MIDGMLSPATCKNDLRKYHDRAGSTERVLILKWLDKTILGRSRSISCLTESIKWQGNDSMLKEIVENSELFSYDLDELIRDGLVEKIYCKNGSDANGAHENFFEVSFNEIDFSPLTWEKCSCEKGLLYAVVRHYMLVLKDGLIPPCYLHHEVKCSDND